MTDGQNNGRRQLMGTGMGRYGEVHELKPFLRRARSVVRNLDVIGTRVGLVGLIIAFDQEVFFFW